jgi:hypothetical protein
MSNFDMSKSDLVMSLKNPMFADKGTDLQAAYDYVDMVAKASDNPMDVWTAVQVAVNTVANCVEVAYE